MATRGNLLPVPFSSPQGVAKAIAARLKQRRLQIGWSRKTLAARAGINPWSLKRFEVSGRIALESLVKMAVVLGNIRDLEVLFAPRPNEPTTLSELEKLHPPARVRGITLS